MLRLIKLMAVVLATVSLILTGCSTTNRPLSQTETYTWGYRYVGANLQPVCKKVSVIILPDRDQGSTFDAQVVDDRFCTQAKPANFTNAS